MPENIVADDTDAEEEETAYEGEYENEYVTANLHTHASVTSLPKIKHKTNPQKLMKDDPMFIYKDFDTSLTKTKGNMNKIPSMDNRTSIRGEDLIRDRLLTFKYRHGSVQTQVSKPNE
jgi:hypothetical protein